jgi:hypothetical protein
MNANVAEITHVAQKPDLVLTREDVSGKRPSHVLREAGVELHLTDKRTLSESLTPPRERS